MRCFVEGIGLYGPGLAGWAASKPILAALETYTGAPISLPLNTLLPANERRRAPQIVKLALAAGSEAFAMAARSPANTPSIFASSGADGETIHDILCVLASPQRELSPTRFHNSVHNTAAGYWSIATESRAPSTSICCYDDSFAAGLLEATAQSATTNEAVVLIAYDVPYPTPLGDVRKIGANFAMALVLTPQATATSFASIDLTLRQGAHAPTTIDIPNLEILRQNTPVARSLPLLKALASEQASSVTISYLEDMALELQLTPGNLP